MTYEDVIKLDNGDEVYWNDPEGITRRANHSTIRIG
jgi:hypothetical protein